MAAAISGLLGLALAKVVGQLWSYEAAEAESSLEERERELVALARDAGMDLPELSQRTKTHVGKKKARKQLQAAKRAQNKKQSDAPVAIVVKTRAFSEDTDMSSNASTCGSDEEDDVEDFGAKEMRLMQERANQVKRLAKQARQPRVTRAKAPTPTARSPAHRFPSVRSPVRLQNVTNELWNWSVHAGFQVDMVAPNDNNSRSLRQIFCDAGEADALDSEELLRSFVECVVADE